MNNLQKYFGSILVNKTSGSGEVLKGFIISMDTLLREVEYTDKDNFFGLLKSLEKELACFALIRHFIKHLTTEINKEKNQWAINNLAKKQITRYLKEWKNVHTQVAHETVKLVSFKSKKVLLHSHSSYVLEVFKVLKSKGILPEVYQTLSAPANEGVMQAKKLGEAGFSVKLINEAAMGRFFRDVDFCITGTDAIYSDCFINKIGTLQLGLLCKHFNKSFYVVADTRKFVNEECSHEVFCEPERPGQEILKNPPKNVVPVNYYFERIPNNLVSRFILEEG